nr:hypothetical protein [Staphylococcus epidermidis]
MYALVTEVKHICFTDVIASQKSLYSHCVINLLKRKKQLLRDINDLHDEKENLTRDIQNLKRKNHFLQEDSQQAQEDIDLYKQLRKISRDDFKKEEYKNTKKKSKRMRSL